MKKVILTIMFIATINMTFAKDYLCYWTVLQLVDHTVDENGRQIKIKNNQLAVNALEETNKKRTQKFNTVYKKSVDRLSNLNLLLDGFIASSDMYQSARQAAYYQNLMVQEIKGMPTLAHLAIPTEIQFVDRTQMLIRYISGIVLSYGTINQMKPGDRKILVDHAIHEMDNLVTLSYECYNSIKSAKDAINIKNAYIRATVNEDKAIIDELFESIKLYN